LASWIESVCAEFDFHSDYQLSVLRLLIPIVLPEKASDYELARYRKVAQAAD
jgi:hypothetical protein